MPKLWPSLAIQKRHIARERSKSGVSHQYQLTGYFCRCAPRINQTVVGKKKELSVDFRCGVCKKLLFTMMLPRQERAAGRIAR